MDRVPEPNPQTKVDDVLTWISRECDAAWTAKLVILRAQRLDDIEHFGQCLREHERHTDELIDLVPPATRALERARSREPRFVTRDPHVIGALVDGDAVLEIMEAIEIERIGRYRLRRGRVDNLAQRPLERLLERHLCDARDRLHWLFDRRGGRAFERAAE